MPLSDEKAEELAKAARAAATNARAAIKEVDKIGDRVSAIEARLTAVERSVVIRTLDILHSSPTLQRGAAAVGVILALVVAALLAPAVIDIIPAIGGSNAATPRP